MVKTLCSLVMEESGSCEMVISSCIGALRQIVLWSLREAIKRAASALTAKAQPSLGLKMAARKSSDQRLALCCRRGEIGSRSEGKGESFISTQHREA